MEKQIKIKFKTDYFPRKKGEVAELETKLANHYLSIGVAEIPCIDCKDKPCSECDKLIEADLKAKETINNKQSKKQKDKMKKLILILAVIVGIHFSAAAQVITMGASAGAVVNTATAYNTLKVDGGYTYASVQTVITKVSGTVGGTVTLQGSVDGTNYETVDLSYICDSTATFTPTDVATNSVIFKMNGAPYGYYRAKYVGTGTMSATVTSYFIGKK